MATKLVRPEAASVRLTIDGKPVEGKKGMTVLQVARRNGIYIPHLCDYEGLSPFSGCRVCLVEIEGRRGLDTSCTIAAGEGMVVLTRTDHVREMQQGVMEALLSEHPDRCLTCPREDRCPPDVVCQRDNLVTDRCVLCPRNKQCELQRVVDFVGIRWNRLGEGRRPPKPERSNPFIERNESYCIYCARCVRVCDEVRGIFALGLSYRGPHTRISVDFDKELVDSPCNFCGACAIVCPTGALIKRDSMYGRIPDNTVPSVCTHCTDGCSLYMNLREGRLVNVLPDVDAPHNQGQLCVRGQFGYDYVYHKERLAEPMLRASDGELRTASWEEALDTAAARLADVVRQHGPRAVGVIGSGHCSNEESYLVQKLARATLGTNNVDQPGRLDHSANVEALLPAFGSAAMTNPIADIALAGCLLVVGSSTVESHEITALRVKKAVRSGAKLIVVDPRRTSLERFAYLYLQPRPGTDLALFNGILKVIVDEHLYDEAYLNERCEGFAELVASLREYDPDHVSALTGVAAEDIVAAARVFAGGGADERYQMPASWLGTLLDPGARPGSDASCIVYGSGVTQQRQATATVHALANLAMVTGNLGKLGGGLCPRVGQHNQQGSVDMGLWPDLLPGYRSIFDEDARRLLAERWGAELPSAPGLTMLEMLEAARQGKLKALYVIGANPLRVAPDAAYVRECLAKLELLVVEEIFPTEMVAMAHVVLPACSAAEKEGTYTNGERRVQWARQAIPPVGNSRADWQIVADLATRVSAKLADRGAVRFDYQQSSDIMREIASVAPDYAGLSYERLRDGGVQWPCPTADHPGTDVLYVDGFDNGKGKLIAAPYEAPEASASASRDRRFPFQLIVGREIYHTNTGALTRRSKGSSKFRREAKVELHPDDVAALGVARGDKVRVISARAEVSAKVEPSEAVAPGFAFLPVHYSECPVNALFPWPDPASLKHPQTKVVPVRVEKATNLT